MTKTLNKPLKVFRFILFLIAIYGLFGFFVLPKIVKPQLVGLLTQYTNLSASIKEVDINPFSFEVTLHHFKAKKNKVSENEDDMFSFEQLKINLAIFPLIEQVVLLEKVELVNPHVDIDVTKEGGLNLDNLLKETPQSETDIKEELPDNPWVFSVRNFMLKQGEISFLNNQLTTPFEQHYKDINITLNNFSTAPNQLIQNTMEATTKRGTVIGWQGEVSLFPFASTGKFRLEGGLQVISDYLQDELLIRITKGQVALAIEYQFAFDDDNVSLTLTDTHIDVTDLAIVEAKTQQSVVDAKRFTIILDEFDLEEKRVQLGSITSDGIKVNTTKNKLSHLGITDLFVIQNINEQSSEEQSSESQNNSASTKQLKKNSKENIEPETPWQLSLNKFAPKNTQLELLDIGYTPAIKHRFDFPVITLLKINPNSDEFSKLEATIIYNQLSSVQLTGMVNPKQKKLNLNLLAKDLKLTNFEHILSSVTNLSIANGNLSGEFKIDIDASQEIPKALVSGTSSLEDFELVNLNLEPDMAKLIEFHSININSMSFQYPENTIDIETIEITNPALHFILDEQYSTNFSQLIKEDLNIKEELEAEIPGLKKAEAYQKEADAFHLAVERISVVDATFTFQDKSIQPIVSVSLDEINGRINNISSNANAVANVKFKGLINKVAPLNIAGTLKPLDHKSLTDINVHINDISLPELSPYSGKYTGYKIAKGHLDVTQSHKIKDSHLSSKNHLVVKKIKLGDTVKSKTATSLPVGLAISLLKDSDNNIDINIPMSGDLDSPSFNYGTVVLGALGSVITTAVSSPFNVLGNLVGSKDNNLDYVRFRSNSSEIRASQQAKLDTLAQALLLKPDFNLQIQGVGSSLIDSREMAYANLLRQLDISVKSSDKNLSKEEESKVIQHAVNSLESSSEVPPTFDQAVELLLKDIPVDNASLLALGKQRAIAIQQYLINNAKVKAAQIKLLESSTETDEKNLLIENAQIKIIFSLQPN
ncbi:MAG: DUF748 domain-containing protein [Colwellia sp.]